MGSLTWQQGWGQFRQSLALLESCSCQLWVSHGETETTQDFLYTMKSQFVNLPSNRNHLSYILLLLSSGEGSSSRLPTTQSVVLCNFSSSPCKGLHLVSVSCYDLLFTQIPVLPEPLPSATCTFHTAEFPLRGPTGWFLAGRAGTFNPVESQPSVIP